MDISLVKRIPFDCRCSVSPNGKRIMVFSDSVISILANDFSVYKEITFKGILDAVCSEHFIYLLQRGGNVFQYNIEDDEVIDLDCPITIKNLPANQKRLRLSFDCSLLTVLNGDSAHVINLLKCSTAIKINQNHESSKVYGLRADYILLLNQNPNELCFQLKDQDQYFEYIFPGMDIFALLAKTDNLFWLFLK